MNLSFFVPGLAVAKGSGRAVLSKATGRAMYLPANPKTRPWQDTMSWHARQAVAGVPPTTGPVELLYCFRFARPKSHYRTGKNAHLLRPDAPPRPATKPDGDKLERTLWDALTGIVYVDDCQVVGWSGAKRYVQPGEPTGVAVKVRTGADCRTLSLPSPTSTSATQDSLL